MKSYFQSAEYFYLFFGTNFLFKYFCSGEIKMLRWFDNYVVDRLSIEYGHPLHSAPSLAPLADAYIFERCK